MITTIIVGADVLMKGVQQTVKYRRRLNDHIQVIDGDEKAEKRARKKEGVDDSLG